jgi:hypothetical protein
MNEEYGGLSPSSGGSRRPEESATHVGRDEAASVGHSVRAAGEQVTQTATEQAKQVAEETSRQARDLIGEARGRAREQASTQQHKAAEGLRALSEELHDMAGRGAESGLATDLARQAAERVRSVASWLERREPGDAVDEIRGLARRRPGAFLLGAALAGVVAGRLTRGVAAAAGGTAPSETPVARMAGMAEPQPLAPGATDASTLAPLPDAAPGNASYAGRP